MLEGWILSNEGKKVRGESVLYEGKVGYGEGLDKVEMNDRVKKNMVRGN